jgi:hypothetical protein
MTPNFFTDVVNVRRRVASTAASRDALNNPVYGDPVSFPIVFTGIKVRLLWSGKTMVFATTGELIRPSGTLYYPTNIILLPEDRIVTVSVPGYANGVEYILTSTVPAFIFSGRVDHMEGQLSLPI